MSRASSGVPRKRRTKKILKAVKGAKLERSKNLRRAKETLKRALAYSYRDRKVKKREFRSLWITRINAATRERGITYSRFIGGLKKNKIELSRDMLCRLAIEEPKAFDALVDIAKSG
ncbi:MAG: 50S ribosomal protein L20 [Candidatus Omnitrophica bacterium]|nr:50S ribosomal protein L20 [Candidatus Omnitrophota bacterium]